MYVQFTVEQCRSLFLLFNDLLIGNKIKRIKREVEIIVSWQVTKKRTNLANKINLQQDIESFKSSKLEAYQKDEQKRLTTLFFFKEQTRQVEVCSTNLRRFYLRCDVATNPKKFSSSSSYFFSREENIDSTLCCV